MSLDDLREQLRADAESVTPPDAVRRLHAVRELNRTRRRRKVTAVVVATVAVVATLVAVPVLSDLAGGPAPVDKPAGPFPEKVDGDTRIASAMGEEGDNSVTLTFTPEDTDFLLGVECDDLASEFAVVRIDGRRTGAMCGTDAPGVATGEVGGVASPGKVRRLWERMGVRAGEPVKVTVRVLDERLTRVRSIEGMIGVAAYDMTGERRNVLGVALPEEKTVNGETYALADDGYVVAPTRPYGSQSSYVPESDEPTFVTYGAADGGTLTRGSIDGAQGALPTTGGISSELLPSGGARTVGVDNMSDDEWAKLVVAYYTPVGGDEENPPDLSIPDTTDAHDPLVASDVGERGESVLRTTFTPEDANIAVEKVCALGGRPSKDVWVEMTMNGRETLSGECQSYDGVMTRGDDPASNRAAWGEFGVVAGDPVDVVIRARAKEGSDVSLDDVQLGFGVYERNAPRTSVNGFVLDDRQRWNGRWYKLADYRSLDVAPGQRRAVLHRSHGDAPILVAWAFDNRARGWAQTWADDERIDYSIRGDGGVHFKSADRATRRLVTKSIGRFEDGRLLLAYYEPE